MWMARRLFGLHPSANAEDWGCRAPPCQSETQQVEFIQRMGFCLCCLGIRIAGSCVGSTPSHPQYILYMSSHIIMILSTVNTSSTYSIWESSASKYAKMPPNLQDSKLKEASAVYPEVAIVDREKRKILLAWVRCRSAGNGLTLTVEVHSTGKAKKFGLVEVSPRRHWHVLTTNSHATESISEPSYRGWRLSLRAWATPEEGSTWAFSCRNVDMSPSGFLVKCGRQNGL